MPKEQSLTPLSPLGFQSPARDYSKQDIGDVLLEFMVSRPSSTFYFWMDSDLMSPLIHEGDLVIVDRSLELRDDCIAVFSYQGDFLVRRFFQKQGKWFFHCENQKTEILIEQYFHTNDFTLFGVVTFALSPLFHKDQGKRIQVRS